MDSNSSPITRVVSVLDAVKQTISARGETYDRATGKVEDKATGKVEDNFARAAAIASLRLDREIHPYEVAIILASVKGARNACTPEHEDSHHDNVAYEAFATVLARGYGKFREDLRKESEP